MQLSSITVPILLIFIATVCASPLYGIGSSNNDIQVISKRRKATVKKNLPESMKELESQLPKDLVVVDSSKFESIWEPYQGKGDATSITGLMGYYSYRMHDGYEGQRAIIKGIWSTVNSKNVAQEGFCLHDMEMLLALFINPNPSADRPNFLFIIKNDGSGYFHQWEVQGLTPKKASQLREAAKTTFAVKYNPTPGFMLDSSWLYKQNEEGKWKAFFI
ncbi:hypothetical protein F5887DRAFT_988742 [Amanita rubescens]|nr:hypothetical protein F5887DRAFT_988742 [Amanita rubescens]